MRKMKKYHYTDSTDMIVYEDRSKKKQKQKKQRIWVPCLCSALAASVLTAGVAGTGFYIMGTQNKADQINIAAAHEQAQQADSTGFTTLAATTESEALTVTEIAAKCGPSVVGVLNKAKVQAKKYYDPYTGRYYYYQDPTEETTETETQSSGSGIIISESGYIITNQHVVEDADEVSVILNTGEEYTATIVGEDEKTDLAVLKIEASTELTAATIGDSTQVQVGDLAVAIGNPLGQEFAGTVTAGVISAVNRTMTVNGRTYNLLQTDAAINSGNSGGALLNCYGEVIGINSVKLSSTGVEGIGFAISISEAMPIIEQLMSQGHVTRPLVGISIQETDYGLFIASVTAGSGAEAAGLQKGDMIMKADGQEVSSTDEINAIRDTKSPGDTMVFTIARDGQTLDVTVTLTEQSYDDDDEEEEQSNSSSTYTDPFSFFFGR